MRDWLNGDLTEEQKVRFRNCWVLLAETVRKTMANFCITTLFI